MFPIALDLTKTKILLIGDGEAFEKRRLQLGEYGATQISLLQPKQGAEKDIQNIMPLSVLPSWADDQLVMVAGLPRDISEKFASEARAAGKLVNVEDMNDLCDFYFTANVKRGDLLIAVSTNGASPTLARRVRDYIGNRFGAEWEARTKEIAEFRSKLKADGKSIPEVLKASDSFLADKGWLECAACPKKDSV